jgi:hypothetical protein
MQLPLRAQLILLFLFSSSAFADQIFDTHLNARALGMGGAYNAVVDDEESLWFNPAGIAKNTGFYWTILDPKVAVSDPSAYSTLQNLQSSNSFQSALSSLYGDPLFVAANAKTAIIMPYFAAAYYYDLAGSVLVNNPVNPTLSVDYILDQGVALGTGFTVGEIMQFGLATRYINRQGVNEDFGAATVANVITGNSSPSTIFNNLKNSGTGYALDLGTNVTLPGPVRPTFSFVWKNVGNTNFRSAAGTTPPPTDEQDMQIGASLDVSAPFIHILPALEIRDLNDSTIQITDKIFMGVELGLPLIDLRAGLYQGYFSYGFGFNLGVIDIEAASWGAEVGGYPGQIESRRYMAQAVLRLGFDLFGGGSSSSSSGKSNSSSSSSGGSSSPDSSSSHIKVRR